MYKTISEKFENNINANNNNDSLKIQLNNILNNHNNYENEAELRNQLNNYCNKNKHNYLFELFNGNLNIDNIQNLKDKITDIKFIHDELSNNIENYNNIDTVENKINAIKNKINEPYIDFIKKICNLFKIDLNNYNLNIIYKYIISLYNNFNEIHNILELVNNNEENKTYEIIELKKKINEYCKQNIINE